jgi:hypothetical protein
MNLHFDRKVFEQIFNLDRWTQFRSKN